MVVQGDIAQTTIELGVIDKVRVVFGIAAASLRQSTLFGQFAVNTGDGPASLVEMRSAPLIEGSIAELTVSDGSESGAARVRGAGSWGMCAAQNGVWPGACAASSLGPGD